jgi:beta-lactamase regulating signal transducer with metallopeptidase domain
MMMGEFLALLFATGAGSLVAIVLVMLARGTLRRLFGPGLAYCAWSAVPMVILAMAFSTGSTAQHTAPVDGSLLGSTGLAFAQLVPAVPVMTQMVLWIWLAGALLTALALFFVALGRRSSVPAPCTRRQRLTCVRATAR